MTQPRTRVRKRRRRSMSLLCPLGNFYKLVWMHGKNRVGKKKKRVKGPDAANKLPAVTPHAKVVIKALSPGESTLPKLLF